MSLAEGSPINRCLELYCYGPCGTTTTFKPGTPAECGCHRIVTCEDCGTTQLVPNIVVCARRDATELNTH